MNNRKIQRTISFLLIALISTSFTIFSFHSHSVSQSDKTGQNLPQQTLSVDSVFCPICAHQFKSPTVPSISGENECQVTDFLPFINDNNHNELFVSFKKGRSPPAIG